MKTLQKTINSKSIILALVIGLAVCLVVVLMVQTHGNQQAQSNTPTKTVSITLDHKTYATLDELRDDSEIVLLGSVLDKGRAKEEKTPAGVSGAPRLVKTDFSVRVSRVLKGDIGNTKTITVVLTGGIIGDTRYVASEMPWLSQGDMALMYLHEGDDGKYYPMAGGAALAIKKKDGKFALPSELSGRSEITVSETAF